jgi:hypothetical protein
VSSGPAMTIASAEARFDAKSVHVIFVVDQSGVGAGFHRVLLFTAVSIIPLGFHTYLHPHVSLTRRSNGRSLGTSPEAVYFRKSGSIGWKNTFNFLSLKGLNSKFPLNPTHLLPSLAVSSHYHIHGMFCCVCVYGVREFLNMCRSAVDCEFGVKMMLECVSKTWGLREGITWNWLMIVSSGGNVVNGVELSGYNNQDSSN